MMSLQVWRPAWQACRGVERNQCAALSCSCTCLAGAAELRGDLERAAGVELPATLAFDYPTPADAAAALAVRMADVDAHVAGASIVQDLEPAAHTPSLQQAPLGTLLGSSNMSLPACRLQTPPGYQVRK